MLTFETALRLIVIGQELLIAVLFLFGRGSRAARASGALLLIGVAAYLLVHDVILREAISSILPAVTLFGMIVPYFLWSFARAIFEVPWPNRWITGGFILIAALVWLVFVAGDVLGPAWVNVANIAMHFASLAIVAHALLLAAKGRADDLIERRRRFRVYFIVIVAIEVAAVLTVELILLEAEPLWVSFVNVVVIAGLTIGLAVPLLGLNPEFFITEHSDDALDEEQGRAVLNPANSVLQQKLLATMSDGAFRDTGLTIRVLAERLNYPEHQLRRLINGYLGYRNFSAFLNTYRIEDARNLLADRDHVRTPVLTIALNLGYGSLGPFNRAFKASTGKTPTEYRQDALLPANADSE